MTEPDSFERTDAIEVCVPASAHHLPVVRSVAVTIAMRADFDVDAISDIELAVDEACSTLVVRAATGATLRCRFVPTDDTIEFAAQVESEDGAPPSTGTFGWRVLDTLTDSARTWVTSDSGPPHLVSIALAKRRQVTPG